LEPLVLVVAFDIEAARRAELLEQATSPIPETPITKP